MFFAVWILPLAATARADSLRAELGRCASIPDVATRVACYDRMTREPEAKRKPEPAERADEAQVAKVASVAEAQPNKLLITLANGEVWQQTVAKAFLIRADDTVRIAGSGWGRSFRLAIDGHPGFIQVSRVR